MTSLVQRGGTRRTIPFNMGNRQKHGLFEKNRGRELRKTEPDCKKPRKIGHFCMLRGLLVRVPAARGSETPGTARGCSKDDGDPGQKHACETETEPLRRRKGWAQQCRTGPRVEVNVSGIEYQEKDDTSTPGAAQEAIQRFPTPFPALFLPRLVKLGKIPRSW